MSENEQDTDRKPRQCPDCLANYACIYDLDTCKDCGAVLIPHPDPYPEDKIGDKWPLSRDGEATLCDVWEDNSIGHGPGKFNLIHDSRDPGMRLYSSHRSMDHITSSQSMMRRHARLVVEYNRAAGAIEALAKLVSVAIAEQGKEAFWEKIREVIKRIKQAKDEFPLLRAELDENTVNKEAGEREETG